MFNFRQRDSSYLTRFNDHLLPTGKTMALIMPGISRCALCQELLDLAQNNHIAFPAVGMSHATYSDLDDAAVHIECLRGWPQRDDFVKVFNEALKRTPRPLPKMLTVDSNGTVVWCAVQREVEQRHGRFARSVGAIVCGIVAGMLIPSAIQVGLGYCFPEENPSDTWYLLIWGEHWALRVLSSWIAAWAGGFIAGLVARKRGPTVAALASSPSMIIWALVAIIGWNGHIPFYDANLDIHLSIGNKLAASLIAITILPAAAFGGFLGELHSENVSAHFDRRHHTLLGIKWYHYCWLPFLIQIAIMQAAWASFYTAGWFKIFWKAGFDNPFAFGNIIPLLFTLGMWGTLVLMGKGLAKAYRILAGQEASPGALSRFFGVMKYGFGYLLFAALLQTAIGLLHIGLAKLAAR